MSPIKTLFIGRPSYGPNHLMLSKNTALLSGNFIEFGSLVVRRLESAKFLNPKMFNRILNENSILPAVISGYNDVRPPELP